MAATRSGGAGSSCLRAWGRGIAGCSELAGGGGGGVAAASKSVHHLQGQGAAGRDLSPALIRVRAGSMRALGPWPMPGAALPCSLTSILVSQHISSRCLLLAAPRPAAPTAHPVYTSPVPRHCPRLSQPTPSPPALADRALAHHTRRAPRVRPPPPNPRLPLPPAPSRLSSSIARASAPLVVRRPRPLASSDRPSRLSAAASFTSSSLPHAPKIPQQ